MSGMDVSIKQNLQEVAKLMQGMKFIRENEVVVGIPKESNGGHAGGVSNAELMYIHSNGSPAHNIPARPTLEPAIRDPKTGQQISKLLMESYKLALDGNTTGARAQMERAGIIGMNATREKFGSADLAPNAPSTIAQKGSSAPLIDKGALQSAITYVVRKK